MRRSLTSIASSLLKSAVQEVPSTTALSTLASTSIIPRAATGAAVAASTRSTILNSLLSQEVKRAFIQQVVQQQGVTFPPRQQSPWSRFFGRGGGGGGSWDSQRVVWSLIAANGGIFMLWTLNPYFAHKHFVVSIDSLTDGRVWTALTAAFSHNTITHLGSNMISLYFFGSDIGRIFGGRKLLILYLAGGVAGSLVHCGWQYYKSQKGGSRFGRPMWFAPGAMGASAAVNAIVVLDVLLFPTRSILLYGIIPMPAALLGLLWLWNDLSGALDGRGSGVAHAGHLGGAAMGLLYYLSLRRRAFGRF